MKSKSVRVRLSQFASSQTNLRNLSLANTGTVCPVTSDYKADCTLVEHPLLLPQVVQRTLLLGLVAVRCNLKGGGLTSLDCMSKRLYDTRILISWPCIHYVGLQRLPVGNVS